VLIQCSVPVKQFLLHLNETGVIGNFVKEDLDATHLLVITGYSAKLEEEVNKFTEANVHGTDFNRAKRGASRKSPALG
jgi:hypothetical protein